MQVKLKCKVALDGKVYPAGVHSLPDSLSKHWFFKALQKDGAAVILEASPASVVKDEDPAPPVITRLGDAPETADDEEESEDEETNEEDSEESSEDDNDGEGEETEPKPAKKKVKKSKKRK